MCTVSVIIVNHNGRDVVLPAIASVLAQERPADEIIVVDNASSDGSVAEIRSRFPSVRVVDLTSNVGFAEGNNIGVVYSTGDCIALLNSDAVADARWLRELTRSLDADQTIGAAVPKIRRLADPARIEQAGASFNELGYCWTRGFNEVDRGQFDEVTEVAALTACSALVQRSALGDEPMFDGQFFMYYEELDLSIRMRENGYRIVYVPSAVVDHRGMESVKRVTTDKDLWQQFYCNRNRLKIVFKYFPAGLVIRKLPLLIAGVAWWDWMFLRRSGVGLFVRAVLDQARFIYRGLRERRLRRAGSRQWLSWMTPQSVKQMRATHASRMA